MANWGDYFANSFTSSYENAAKRKFEEYIAKKRAEASQQLMGGTGIVGQPPSGTPELGQPPMIGSGISGNSPFVQIGVPSVDEYGNIVMKPQVYQNPAFKAEATARAKDTQAVNKKVGDFGRVATAVKQLADYYKGAIEEGGAGNWGNKLKGSLVTGKLGGQMGEQMENTGKLYGQTAELTLSLMPILTNQNRFLSTVAEYINKSLPQGHEGAKLASSKLAQTLENQYRTTKVLMKLGYDPSSEEDVSEINNMDDDEAGMLAKKVVGLAQVYKLSKEDKKELDGVIEDALGSLKNYSPTNKKKSYSSLWS